MTEKDERKSFLSSDILCTKLFSRFYPVSEGIPCVRELTKVIRKKNSVPAKGDLMIKPFNGEQGT